MTTAAARIKSLTKENMALRKEVKLLRHALTMLATAQPSAHIALVAGVICEDGRYEVTIASKETA